VKITSGGTVLNSENQVVGLFEAADRPESNDPLEELFRRLAPLEPREKASLLQLVGDVRSFFWIDEQLHSFEGYQSSDRQPVFHADL
jgi:hypothetical protein